MARQWNETVRELLDLLYWGTQAASRPLTHSAFEVWQQWHGFSRSVARLEQNQLLLREQQAGRIVCHLTDLGRMTSLGGRHPEQQWQRPWDGQWRMLVFDLPANQKRIRARLLRWLRQNGFGYLQDSVWIHPDPVAELVDALKDFRDDVESCTLLEAHCCVGYSNAALAAGAWRFQEINKRHETYLSQAEGLLRRLPYSRDCDFVRRRLREQRRGWANAMQFDPLLPQALLPRDYLGQRAWQIHRELMTTLVEILAEHDVA
jgi:phenylacetic acid degradation operon negative regulatory protein